MFLYLISGNVLNDADDLGYPPGTIDHGLDLDGASLDMVILDPYTDHIGRGLSVELRRFDH